MAKIKTATSKIILKTSKFLSDGKNPVMLRITFNRVQKHYSLRMSSSSSNWDKQYGRYKKNRDANIRLNYIQTNAEKIFETFRNNGVPFSFERFEKKFFVNANSKSVGPYFDAVIDDLKTKNRLGSFQTYTETLKRLKEVSDTSVLTFQDINFKYINDLEKHLIEKGNSPNTIGIYLRTLRAVFNRAIKEDIVPAEYYPFKDFKIKKVSTSKRALTKIQIKQLLDYKAEEGTRKQDSLFYFIFSYLCRGMNFTDLAQLKWDNIHNERLFYSRKKTSDAFSIELKQEIRSILNHFREKGALNDYIFPILEKDLKSTTIRYRIKDQLKKINKDLKEICGELKIPGANKVTFYWARHTYATTLKRAGVSISLISESLGHSTEKVTQAYLDSFENTELDKTYQHLI